MFGYRWIGMKPTDQTLMKQMHISSDEIEYRKSLLCLSNVELQRMMQLGNKLEHLFDQVIIDFYQQQTSISEIATLIGDVGTLSRLQRAQRQYLTELFQEIMMLIMSIIDLELV